MCVAEREPAGGNDGALPPSSDDPFGLAALWRAYRACRQGKRNTRDTQRYEARLLDQLVSTRDALASLRWRPSRTLSFVVTRPKLREIHAASFADRVTHHLLVERLNRLFEPVFIHDSYANRRGKGTHAAVDRLQVFMRSASEGGRLPVHALQLDIANYFNSIHRPTLFRLVQQRLLRAVRRRGLEPSEAQALQAHSRALLSADPTAGVRRQGPPSRFEQIPPHKRLGALGPGYGLPVGNLTSQFFANVYLNELDQFVKHELKARWYLRYVDDFVLLHRDPEVLVEWRERIAAFLAERLHLRLKEIAEPRLVSRGVDFLGYLIRTSHRVVRRRVIRHFHERLQAFERAHVRPNALRLPPPARDRLRAQVASFLGHCHHASARRVWQQTLARFPWLNLVFDRPEEAILGQPLRPAWTPTAVPGLGGQYRSLARHRPEALLILQVGNRWILPVNRLPGVATPVGAGLPAKDSVSGAGSSRSRPLPPRADSRTTAVAETVLAATAPRHYPSLGPCHEYRTEELPALRRRLKRAGRAHVLAAQTGHYRTGFKRRERVLLWQPAGGGSFLFPPHFTVIDRGAS